MLPTLGHSVLTKRSTCILICVILVFNTDEEYSGKNKMKDHASTKGDKGNAYMYGLKYANAIYLKSYRPVCEDVIRIF